MAVAHAMKTRMSDGECRQHSASGDEFLKIYTRSWEDKFNENGENVSHLKHRLEKYDAFQNNIKIKDAQQRKKTGGILSKMHFFMYMTQGKPFFKKHFRYKYSHSLQDINVSCYGVYLMTPHIGCYLINPLPASIWYNKGLLSNKRSSTLGLRFPAWTHLHFKPVYPFNQLLCEPSQPLQHF